MNKEQLYKEIESPHLPYPEATHMVEQMSIEELRRYREKLLALVAITNTVLDHKSDSVRKRENTGW